MTPDRFRYRYDHFFKMLSKHLNEEKNEYLKAHPEAKPEEMQPSIILQGYPHINVATRMLDAYSLQQETLTP